MLGTVFRAAFICFVQARSVSGVGRSSASGPEMLRDSGFGNCTHDHTGNTFAEDQTDTKYPVEAT